ncbi:hypothetical protein BJ912DRAFT_611296 [Pholiota molesta]|nr:hypothetical protein BJ912DRAFT_611296 [Pholiota molesta]
MPSPSQMAERVLAAHHIREEDGVVFLESQPEFHYLKELERYLVHAPAFGQEHPSSIFRSGSNTLYPTSIVSSGASSFGWSPFGSTSTLISHNTSTSSRTSSKASSDGWTAFGSASTLGPPKLSMSSNSSRSNSLGNSPTYSITRPLPYGSLISGPSSLGLVPTNPATLAPTGTTLARSPLSGGKNVEPRIVSHVDRPPEYNVHGFESQLNMSPEDEVELELDEIPPIKSTLGQQLYGVPKSSDGE